MTRRLSAWWDGEVVGTLQVTAPPDAVHLRARLAGGRVALLKAPKTTAAFHDFETYERLVEAARTDALAYPIVLLGGEAGLRLATVAVEEWWRRRESNGTP